MTKEEALVEVRGYLTDYLPLDSIDEIDEIIKALGQEQCGKKNYKKEARRWKRRYLDLRQRIFKSREQLPEMDVLDKIIAEIQENINYNKKMNYQGIVAGLLLTLDIIDKYRKESEDDKK